MVYKAEYIWIDGTEPTARLRSKTKILDDGASLPIWGFDGSSTNQAPGKNSDCVLRPVFSCPDPLRGDPHVLVMCEVLLTDMTPHTTNTRAQLEAVADKFAAQDIVALERLVRYGAAPSAAQMADASCDLIAMARAV